MPVQKKINLDKVSNIFDSPSVMKEWGNQFTEACGNHIFSVQPNMIKLKMLMDRFVVDYNKQLETLEPLKEEE